MTATESQTAQSRSIVEQFYDAGLRGDIETMMGFLSDDVVIYEPAFLAYGGKYRGKQGLQAIYEKVLQVTDVMQLKVHYFVVDGDRALAIAGFPVNGTEDYTLFAEESRLVDGKIVEIRLYYYEPQSLLRVPATEAGV
ncbi:nuclear transport factor 2 family protein [Mycobacterium arosiense]|uniref:SnoaL-like domain-containing protein n=1 Tax=Mycobacterium arosiense ATCC BAA-1401 = DSM 45069 TaxID=1265311 RepID=A0A1W9ZAQ0_MYCAI|nr:nuclear transport factor 2 family protein [Mycobacterium arosiense]ORA10374.1 hypothetical protein BST14_20530 [Mycobacterium arosiense ATCC BAA-1401 = DSM 45069]